MLCVFLSWRPFTKSYLEATEHVIIIILTSDNEGREKKYHEPVSEYTHVATK